MKRLGVDRTGLFNGLIPITALAAVALTGTGTIMPIQVLAALTVLAGVILGLGRSPQANGTVNQAGQRPQPGAGTALPSRPAEPAPAHNAAADAGPYSRALIRLSQ